MKLHRIHEDVHAAVSWSRAHAAICDHNDPIWRASVSMTSIFKAIHSTNHDFLAIISSKSTTNALKTSVVFLLAF
jgi:hypothetical protein